MGQQKKRVHLQELCKLSKYVEVQPKLVAAVVWLSVPPYPEAASVLGQDKHDAVIADSKVVQPADAWDVAEALHNSNFLEGSHLHGHSTVGVCSCKVWWTLGLTSMVFAFGSAVSVHDIGKFVQGMQRKRLLLSECMPLQGSTLLQSRTLLTDNNSILRMQSCISMI